jgi:MFS transporter, DHA2 family, glioxin efflux transporter
MLKKLGSTGPVLLHGAVIVFLIAMQTGGIKEGWSSPKIIAELTIFGVLLSLFFLVESYLSERAILPLRFFKSWTICITTLNNFCLGGVYFTLTYFMPIYFQAVKGTNAMGAGIDTVPLVVAMILCACVTNFSVARVGYVPAFLIPGCILLAVGCGLLRLLDAESSPVEWIGIQIVVGAALGITSLLDFLAAQTVLKKEDVEVGTALVSFHGHNSG